MGNLASRHGHPSPGLAVWQVDDRVQDGERDRYPPAKDHQPALPVPGQAGVQVREVYHVEPVYPRGKRLYLQGEEGSRQRNIAHRLT
jgi:hypothetical protein